MLLSLALMTSVCTIFVPLKDMNEMRTSGSLKNKSAFNFVLVWLNYALWAIYSSHLRSLDVVCGMYFMGLIASCGYCCYYIYFVKDRETKKKIAYLYLRSVMAVALVAIYSRSGIHSLHDTNHIVGLLACIATVCLAMFPLFMTPVVPEAAPSSVSMPIYLTNTTNFFLWFAYGYTIHDPYTTCSNLFAFLCSAVGIVIITSGKVNIIHHKDQQHM